MSWIDNEAIYDVEIVRRIKYNDKNEVLTLYDYNESHIPSMEAIDKLVYDSVLEALKYRRDNNILTDTIVTSVSVIDKIRRRVDGKRPVAFGTSEFYKPIKIGGVELKVKIDNTIGSTYTDYRFEFLPKITKLPKTYLTSSSFITSFGKDRKYELKSSKND